METDPKPEGMARFRMVIHFQTYPNVQAIVNNTHFSPVPTRPVNIQEVLCFNTPQILSSPISSSTGDLTQGPKHE